MSIQVAVDVPSSPYVDMEDFKKQVADYAKVLYNKMSIKNAPSTSAMKPLEELSPMLFHGHTIGSQRVRHDLVTEQQQH